MTMSGSRSRACTSSSVHPVRELVHHQDLGRQALLPREPGELALELVDLLARDQANGEPRPHAKPPRRELRVEGDVHERLAQEGRQQPHLGQRVAPADLGVEEEQQAVLAGGLDVLRDALVGEVAEPVPLGRGPDLSDAHDQVIGPDRAALTVELVVALRPDGDARSHLGGRPVTEHTHRRDVGP